MSQVAAIVAYLALAGAVASWIAGAWFYAATVRDLSERPGSVNWFTVAAWPFALGRLKGAAPPRTVRVNKALIVCLACLTVAVAATSIATNLARVSR